MFGVLFGRNKYLQSYLREATTIGVFSQTLPIISPIVFSPLKSVSTNRWLTGAPSTAAAAAAAPSSDRRCRPRAWRQRPHPRMRIPVAYLSLSSSSSTSVAHRGGGGGGALLLPSTAAPVAPRPPSGRDPSLHGGSSWRPAAPTWTARLARLQIHGGVHSADPPPPRAWRLLLADVGATVASRGSILPPGPGLSIEPSLLLPSIALGSVCFIIDGHQSDWSSFWWDGFGLTSSDRK